MHQKKASSQMLVTLAAGGKVLLQPTEADGLCVCIRELWPVT